MITSNIWKTIKHNWLAVSSLAIICITLFGFGSSFEVEAASSSRSQQYPIVEIESNWLWDPESPDLEDWQIQGRSRGVIVSPQGDVIVADSDNARLVRFTIDGELIELIGRSGSGPGEFLIPRELGFEPDSNVLWVADIGLSRVSRFNVSETASTLINTFSCPQLRGGQPQSMTVRDSTSFYTNMISADYRIALINDHSEIIELFGEMYTPQRTLTETKTHSYGIINLSNNNNIIFVGTHIPIYERWSADGNLLLSKEIQFPEYQILRDYEKDLTPDRQLKYNHGAVYISTTNTIFVWLGGKTTYEVSLESFTIIRCYHVQGFGSGTPGIFTVNISADGEVRFIFVREGGVMIAKKM